VLLGLVANFYTNLSYIGQRGRDVQFIGLVRLVERLLNGELCSGSKVLVVGHVVGAHTLDLPINYQIVIEMGFLITRAGIQGAIWVSYKVLLIAKAPGQTGNVLILVPGHVVGAHTLDLPIDYQIVMEMGSVITHAVIQGVSWVSYKVLLIAKTPGQTGNVLVGLLRRIINHWGFCGILENFMDVVSYTVSAIGPI
jgi:hypothetical protein